MNDIEFTEYWDVNGAALFKSLEKKIDPTFCKLLEDAFGIIGVATGMGQQAIVKNEDLSIPISPMIILAADYARGAIAGYKAFSLSTLWILNRSAMENYLNFRYIISHPDRLNLAAQYSLFGDLQKALHGSKLGRVMPEQKKIELLEKSTPWKTKRGGLHLKHWLGSGKSYNDIVKHFKDHPESEQDVTIMNNVADAHWISSNINHGSAASGSLYRQANGLISPFGPTDQCAMVAASTLFYGAQIARIFSETFGTIFPTETDKRIFDSLGSYIKSVQPHQNK